jgi:ubiquinone/menaquinone biosynthesis C-methylase UbiE
MSSLGTVLSLRRAAGISCTGGPRMPRVLDPVRKRFSESAAAIAELQDKRAAETAEHVNRLLTLTGDERALDVGTGAGAFALALAPLVREVVGVDVVPELLAEARKRAPANVEFVEANGEELPFRPDAFDVVCTARTLHHMARPEVVLDEMTRVLRPGGTMLVVDQLAPADPLAAIELNRFEVARDPSTTRILPDVDLRVLFDSNGLVLQRSELAVEERDVEHYLDLAHCHGEDRDRARSLAPSRPTATYGWYVLTRPTV